MKKIDSSLFTVFKGAELTIAHKILGGLTYSQMDSSEAQYINAYDSSSDHGDTWSITSSQDDSVATLS